MEKLGLTTLAISIDELEARRQKFAPGQTVRYSSRFLRENALGWREKEALGSQRFTVVKQRWSSRRILIHVLHIGTNTPMVFVSSDLTLAR